MPLVLAIEPDARQGAVLQRIVRDHVHAELLLVDSPDAAVASLATQIPDVILLSMLLAPADEEDLIERLRSLDGGRHIQTYTIPQFASTPADLEDASGRFLGKLRKKKGRAPAHTPGCDPDLFATEVVTFLSRAQELKEQSEGEAARMLRRSPRDAAAESPAEGAADADTPDAGAAEDSSWASPFEWRRTSTARPAAKPAKARIDRSQPPAGEAVEEPEQTVHAGAAAADAGAAIDNARESAGEIQAEAIAQQQEEDERAATEERLRLEALARAEEARLNAELEEADRLEREARERAEAEAALERAAEAARQEREAEALAQQERQAREAEAAAAAERQRDQQERARQAAEAEAARRLGAEIAALAEAAAREQAEREQLRVRLEVEQREREAAERQRLDAEAAAQREEAERLALAAAAAEERRLLDERERLAAERAETERMEEAARQASAALAQQEEDAARLAVEAAEAARDAQVDPEQVRRERLAAAQETARRRREEKARKAAAAKQRRRPAPAQASVSTSDQQPEGQPAASTGASDLYAEFREDHDHPRGPLRLLPVDAWARVEQSKPDVDVVVESSPLHGLIAGLSVPAHVAVISYPRGCRIRRVRVRTLAVADDDLGEAVIVSRSALDAARGVTEASAS